MHQRYQHVEQRMEETTVMVDKTFSLEDAAKAHETMESRNFFGKLVLTVP